MSFDIQAILRCQNNRSPVLLIDRIVDVQPGSSARGVKCFTYNEWFFPGHFEDDPNVPGFVLVESLVQTFIMTFLCMPEYQGLKTSFVSIDRAKFRRKVVPGDVLTVDATLRSFRRGIAMGSAEGRVGGDLACCADFVVAVPAVVERFTPRATGE